MSAQAAAAPTERLHIDTDPGLDDLVALVLALACPEGQLCALTTVAGNASIDAVTENAQRFLALVGCSFPVGRGADRPLALSSVDATWYHGEDGRRGIHIPAIDRRPLPSAQQVLRQSLREASVSKLVALGPLTNVAALVESDPELFAGVEIVWMGGTLAEGNVTGVAEFNCYADPKAADLVLGAGLDVRVIGLEITREVRFPEDALKSLSLASDPISCFVRDLLSAQMDAEEPVSGERRATLHDPCAVLAALPLDLFRYEPRRLRVLVEEGDQRGRLLEDPTRLHPVQYATEVRCPELLRAFGERIGAYCRAGK